MRRVGRSNGLSDHTWTRSQHRTPITVVHSIARQIICRPPFKNTACCDLSKRHSMVRARGRGRAPAARVRKLAASEFVERFVTDSEAPVKRKPQKETDHVTRQLIEAGHRPRLLVRNPDKPGVGRGARDRRGRSRGARIPGVSDERVEAVPGVGGRAQPRTGTQRRQRGEAVRGQARGEAVGGRSERARKPRPVREMARRGRGSAAGIRSDMDHVAPALLHVERASPVGRPPFGRRGRSTSRQATAASPRSTRRRARYVPSAAPPMFPVSMMPII